jgi:hypothetical protein
MPNRPTASLAGFLICAFMVVGLTGLFATYAVPVPLERALRREAAIDQAGADLAGPDAGAKLQALAPELGEQAAMLSDASVPLAERVRRAQAAVRDQMTAEAGEIATRLRWLIAVITVCAGGFGTALMLVAGRRA